MKALIKIQKNDGSTKAIDIGSPCFNQDLDEFMDKDDEFRIVDSGVLGLFANITEFESLHDLIDLYHGVKQQPFGYYLVGDYLRRNTSILTPRDGTRISPSVLLQYYSSFNYGQVKDERAAFDAMFAYSLLKEPKSTPVRKAMDACFDHKKFLSIASEHGYQFVKFMNWEPVGYSVPDAVKQVFREWGADAIDAIDRRRGYAGDDVIYTGNFVYITVPSGATFRP